MRTTLRLLGIGFWSLLSLDVLVAFIDWLARWDWLKAFMADHPRFAAFVHTPFVYAVLLILGFLFLQAERKLKQPRIVARYVNRRMVPNLHKITVQQMFDESKPEGVFQKLNWILFVEIALANDSETPSTIEDVKVRVRVGHKWWFKKPAKAEHVKDISHYKIDKGFDEQANFTATFSGSRYSAVPSLLDETKGQPLTRGVGHRGWIRLDVEEMSKHEINNRRMWVDIWLVDALEGLHKVSYRRKSDVQWDKNFLIFEDSP